MRLTEVVAGVLGVFVMTQADDPAPGASDPGPPAAQYTLTFEVTR